MSSQWLSELGLGLKWCEGVIWPKSREALPAVTRSREVKSGVSVVICTHNGQDRLPQTLAHLARQSVNGIEWEVIVVDNASRDATAAVAKCQWPPSPPCALRIIHEDRLGLSFAVDRGFSEANYEFVLLVDDDNWLSPNYVQLAHDVLQQNPRLGACGGYAEPVTECELPTWYHNWQQCYAVGPQGLHAGDVSSAQGYLWGAGTCVRRTAYQGLFRAGFKRTLTDRQGNALSSGGDVELCYALRLAGWLLWYEPRLRLRHFQTPNRLEWEYLKRLFYCNGMATAILDIYKLHLDGCPIHNRVIGANWSARLAIALVNVCRASARVLVSCGSRESTLRLEERKGILSGLVQYRGKYRAVDAAVGRLAKKLRSP